MEKANSLVKATSQFAECVSLISASDGVKGNIMPAAWCAPVSFYPTMVVVNISPDRYTHDLIKKSKEFGVNILSEDQMGLSKFAGSCSGRTVDKLKNMKTFQPSNTKCIRQGVIYATISRPLGGSYVRIPNP